MLEHRTCAGDGPARHQRGETMTERQKAWTGVNWVRQSTRLAIYLRDGLACVWCGHAVEDGAQLALDHVRPHSKGGTNEPTNLVTACMRCNSSRGDRPVRTFARAVAEYLNHGATTTPASAASCPVTRPAR